MSDSLTYSRALEMLKKRDTKKIANNTYLIRGEAVVKVRLHATDILHFYADGSVAYNSGGWKTVTTKERMNRFGPEAVRIWSARGTWMVATPNPEDDGYAVTALFQDGMVYRNKRLEGAEPLDELRKDQKRRREVANFCRRFMDAFEKGEVPAPGAGDCFYCGLRRTDTGVPMGEAMDTLYPDGTVKVQRSPSHIESHIEENYYVPSLLHRALEVGGASKTMWWWVGSWWDETASEEVRRSSRHWSERSRVEKALRKYVFRQLGMAA